MSKSVKKRPVEKRKIPWVEKYRPRSLKAVLGVDSKKEALVKFLKGFPKTRAAVLIGPPGVGKTTLVLAAARDMNMDLIEMNASDARSADAIKKKIYESTKSKSITDFIGSTKGKIILIDEVDGIHGTQDRGGIPALVEIIQSSEFPIIMTSNERLTKLNSIYKISVLIKFSVVRKESILKVLKAILKREGLLDLVPEGSLKEISENARGDFRSAINDLQSLVEGLLHQKQDSADLLDNLTSTRDEFLNIFKGITKLFNSSNIKEARDVVGMIDMPNVSSNFQWDTIVQYILENLHSLTRDDALVGESAEILSRADEILGFIKRTQNWSMLSYFIDFIGVAISIIKQGDSGRREWKQDVVSPKFRFFRDSSPKELIEKVSTALNVSNKDITQELLPVMKELFNEKERAFKDELVVWMELDSAGKKKLESWSKK